MYFEGPPALPSRGGPLGAAMVWRERTGFELVGVMGRRGLIYLLGMVVCLHSKNVCLGVWGPRERNRPLVGAKVEPIR